MQFCYYSNSVGQKKNAIPNACCVLLSHQTPNVRALQSWAILAWSWSLVAIGCHSHALRCCSCTLRVEMFSVAVACLRMITRIALHVDIKLPVVQTRSAPE
jgi:hypothetical protein